MKPRLPRHRLWAVLALLALIGAQVFGLARGYVCDCAGRLEWTAQDHCHGPHGPDCHRAAASPEQHHENDGPQDRRDHGQLRDEVLSRLAQTLEAPALVPLLVVFFGEEATWSADVSAIVSMVRKEANTGPPLGVAVARTTVLLI